MPKMIDKAKLLEYLAAIKPDEYVSAYGEAAVDVINHVETYVNEMPTIEAEPVRHGRWNNTEETVWDAKEIDGKQQLEISIVAARCSACGHWSEQVNQFPPYMHYKFCPHCGARMDG